MLSAWISFLIGVLLFWRQAAIEAAWKSWLFVGQTREGVMFASLVLLVFFVYLWWKHGWNGIWSKFWEKALEALVMTLVAAALLFLWELFCEPWAQVSWVTSQMEQARTAERSANLRKDGDAAIIAQQKIEIISLRSKKSPPLLGHLSSGAQPDIDQICEKLESCPSPELRKRVLRFANKLDDFYLQYDIAVKKEDALSGQAHEAIVRGLRVQMSARYRSDFEPDVLAYRKVVISRLPPGSVDHSQDSLYENQGPGWASFSIIENVNNIAGDLRQLASQLPEH